MGRAALVTFDALFLAGITACLASCATIAPPAGEPRPTDARAEDRLVMMHHQIREQEAEIERLTAALEAAKARTPEKGAITQAPRPKARDPWGDKRALFAEEAQAESLPVKKLTPADADPEDDDAADLETTESAPEGPVRSAVTAKDAATRNDGESIADSTHETMHLYYRGLQQLQEGQYEDAQASFREFLKLSPNHVYADRAQYLVAEAHFKSHELGLVVIATNVLESRYPHSFRVPDALYKRALALDGMGQPDQARATLRDLLKRFPKDPTADGASRLLASLAGPREKGTKPVPLIEDIN